MSHLFNQGTNAIELLKVEPKAVEQLQELIIETAVAGEAEGFFKPLAEGKFGVVFGIVTHKDQNAKSENLPLFSRISLMRSARWLKVFVVKNTICWQIGSLWCFSFSSCVKYASSSETAKL